MYLYLNVRYFTVYHYTEHLVVVEVIVLFKGLLFFRQCILNKHKISDIKSTTSANL
jgi:hypothetical protein